jgi:hypothetical protein
VEVVPFLRKGICILRDLQSGTTRLVSRSSGASGAGADDASLSASISGNGRYVAFESLADNLSTDDDNIVSTYSCAISTSGRRPWRAAGTGPPVRAGTTARASPRCRPTGALSPSSLRRTT